MGDLPYDIPFRLVSRVGYDDGMEVPVSDMAEGGDGKAVSLAPGGLMILELPF